MPRRQRWARCRPAAQAIPPGWPRAGKASHSTTFHSKVYYHVNWSISRPSTVSRTAGRRHEGRPTITVHTRTMLPAMSRGRALVVAGHPGPSLAITALVTMLAAQAAPHGIAPLLTGPAMLAGQLSIGWSNDAVDADRDAAVGRTDKPVAAGAISKRAVWIAAFA